MWLAIKQHCDNDKLHTDLLTRLHDEPWDPKERPSEFAGRLLEIAHVAGLRATGVAQVRSILIARMPLVLKRQVLQQSILGEDMEWRVALRKLDSLYENMDAKERTIVDDELRRQWEQHRGQAAERGRGKDGGDSGRRHDRDRGSNRWHDHRGARVGAAAGRDRADSRDPPARSAAVREEGRDAGRRRDDRSGKRDAYDYHGMDRGDRGRGEKRP